MKVWGLRIDLKPRRQRLGLPVQTLSGATESRSLASEGLGVADPSASCAVLLESSRFKPGCLDVFGGFQRGNNGNPRLALVGGVEPGRPRLEHESAHGAVHANRGGLPRPGMRLPMRGCRRRDGRLWVPCRLDGRVPSGWPGVTRRQRHGASFPWWRTC